MGKNAQNMLTNHPKYPCLTRISLKSAPNHCHISKMIWGILLVARYTFSLTGYPKIAYIGCNLGWNIPKIWWIPISHGKNFKCCFSDIFEVFEFESEVCLALKILVLPILGYVNFDCPWQYTANSQTHGGYLAGTCSPHIRVTWWPAEIQIAATLNIEFPHPSPQPQCVSYLSIYIVSTSVDCHVICQGMCKDELTVLPSLSHCSPHCIWVSLSTDMVSYWPTLLWNPFWVVAASQHQSVADQELKVCITIMKNLLS